ncbi:MAG: hypothetical protein IJU66_03590 [Oscillospiraceae bacterium]|nr:hypothetical protein [Oscillospiraceae bacterium]
MKKRTISIIAAILACAVVFAGCGGQKNNSAENSAQTAQAESSAQDTAQNTAQDAAQDTVQTPACYRILVTDEAGNPVEGVSVQFCSDTLCKLAPTGADGTASFDDPEGDYTVHILKAPDGYEKDGAEYAVPQKYGTLTIVLKRSAS